MNRTRGTEAISGTLSTTPIFTVWCNVDTSLKLLTAMTLMFLVEIKIRMSEISLSHNLSEN